MRELGFPVQEVYQYTQKPQGSVIFTPAEGFPDGDDDQQVPLYEALRAHFQTEEPFIVGYHVVSRETMESALGVKFNGS